MTDIIQAPPEIDDTADPGTREQQHRERHRWLSRLIDLVLGGSKQELSVVPGTVNAQSTKEVDVNVSGAEVGDGVVANKPTATAGIVIGNARVKSAGVVSILFGNVTGGNIAVPTEDYLITVIRR